MLIFRIVPLIALLAAANVALAADRAAGIDATPTSSELADLSLEALGNLQITSVSKRPERLAVAPAAIYVITADDIRRSGASRLPEVLRLAPNLQVSQVSASGYAIRARGVYNNSANKLLVLVDGRSVYTPLFAGVFWDVQDLMLEDIERIEVISGPGGTLWGVNAVNGVINVITRHARDTQGGLVSTGGGDAGSDVGVRYGARLGEQGHFRVHARYLDRASTSTAAGGPIDDAAFLGQVGFRADWSGARDQLMVQGNAYRGTIDQPLPGSISIGGVVLALAPIPVSGRQLTARWTRHLEGGSEASVLAYYDRTERTVAPTFAEQLELLDLQVQHSMPVGSGSLVWGGEYRSGRDRVSNGELFGFLPTELDQAWSSLFGQLEMPVTPSVRVTAGARLERNDYTGTEFLPNVRASWKVDEDAMVWSAVSRAVRAPARLDRDAVIPSTPPFLLAGGPDVRSEVANVYELGYRGAGPGPVSYSVTVYRADYDDLHTQEVAPSGTFLVFGNGMRAKTTGIEAWGAWQAAERWRISAGYMAQRETFRLKADSSDAVAPLAAGRDPAHAWLVRSAMSLRNDIEWDVTLRGVAALSSPEVSAYRTLDTRIGWKPMPRLEVSLALTNLADGGHGEFTGIATRTEVGRTVYLGLRWRFDGP